MRLKTLFYLFILTIGSQSCNEEDCCLPADLNDLPGEYLVYEYGYSPGDRYIVEQVPAEPPQLLIFDISGAFESNYGGLTDFNHYRVYEHPTEGKILALYKDNPPPDDQVDLALLQDSYIMSTDEGNLRLYYRYCIEGCHIGVKRLK